MNPLDLRGGGFLLFYLSVCAGAYFLMRYHIRRREAEWEMPKLSLSDPYEIAFLRGGENEAIRVAAFSLIDRELLEVTETTLTTKAGHSVEHARRPLEKAILRQLKAPGYPDSLFSASAISDCAEEYRGSLRKLRLVPDSDAFNARYLPLILALGAGLGLALLKIQVALSRGKGNIGFLIMLAILFAVMCFREFGRNRTGLGDRAIEDLRLLFRSLKTRAHTLSAGGRTNEAVLVAAIFGLSALTGSDFLYLKRLFAKGGSGNDSGGTSCGSSSGCGSSSSGGGCGGGGCGGCGGD